MMACFFALARCLVRTKKTRRLGLSLNIHIFFIVHKWTFWVWVSFREGNNLHRGVLPTIGRSHKLVPVLSVLPLHHRGGFGWDQQRPQHPAWLPSGARIPRHRSEYNIQIVIREQQRDLEGDRWRAVSIRTHLVPWEFDWDSPQN